MKKIIKGTTYNTETADMLAEGILYRTRRTERLFAIIDSKICPISDSEAKQLLRDIVLSGDERADDCRVTLAWYFGEFMCPACNAIDDMQLGPCSSCGYQSVRLIGEDDVAGNGNYFLDIDTARFNKWWNSRGRRAYQGWLKRGACE